MRLNNKIAIITGSASGFGKGIAEKFTQEGANLILVDVNSKLLKKVSKNLSQDYFVADVSKASNFNTLLKYAYKKYNSVDIFVNNAGITHKPKPMETVTENEFDKVYYDQSTNNDTDSVLVWSSYFETFYWRRPIVESQFTNWLNSDYEESWLRENVIGYTPT